MGLFAAIKSTVAETPEQKAQRIAKRAQLLGRHTPEELAGIPVTRERFQIDVVENIATAGFGLTSKAKYRYHVTDTATGVPQKTDYALTHGQAHMFAAKYVEQILAGKKTIK